MKKVLALALCVCMAAMLLAGCGGAGSSSAAASASGSAAAGTSASDAGALDPNIKATLTFATWDNEAMDLYDELDLEGRFQELYPNVNIEIEEFKDDDEYFNQMKIRASAGELPDLMYLQTPLFPCVQGLYGGFERHQSGGEQPACRGCKSGRSYHRYSGKAGG